MPPSFLCKVKSITFFSPRWFYLDVTSGLCHTIHLYCRKPASWTTDTWNKVLTKEVWTSKRKAGIILYRRECLDDSNTPTGDNWNSHLFVLGKSPSEHMAWKMWRSMSFSRWILGSWRCSWEKKKNNKHEIITFKLLCLGVRSFQSGFNTAPSRARTKLLTRAY